MMAKLVSLLIVGFLGMGQVATQATPQIKQVLDLNGDKAVDVADVALYSSFIFDGGVRGGRVWFLWAEERERECMYHCDRGWMMAEF